MPRPRFKKLAAEKQEQILEAAADEFGEKGFDAASINKIIARAGISKGAAYYYFDDKSDLYVTVIENAIGRIKSWVGGGWSPDDLEAETFWEDLHDYSIKSLRFMKNNAWASRLFKTFWAYAESHSEDRSIQLMWRAARNWTRNFIERGQALGVMRDDIPIELLIDIFIGSGTAVDRWLMARIDDFDEQELDQTAEMLIDMYRRLSEPRATEETS